MKGCIHIRIVNGVIGNIFTHLTEIPESDGIIHLSNDGIEFLSEKDFVESHQKDRNELMLNSHRSVFPLGDDSVTIFE